MDEKKDEKTTDPLLEENLTKKIKTEKFSSEIMTAVKRNGSKVCSRKFLYNRLPILTWICGYNLEMLLCDTIAGVTTALTVIPQGIGYAPLAGLPLQYGLYCSVVPGFVYCLFGTIRFTKAALTTFFFSTPFFQANNCWANCSQLLDVLQLCRWLPLQSGDPVILGGAH